MRQSTGSSSSHTFMVERALQPIVPHQEAVFAFLRCLASLTQSYSGNSRLHDNKTAIEAFMFRLQQPFPLPTQIGALFCQSKMNKQATAVISQE